MYTSALLATFLAALAAAAPSTSLETRQSKYYGISLHVDTNPAGQPETASPAPIEINKLTSLGGVSASKLSFDTGVAINVDINSIECRAYKDADGVVPGSAPFTAKQPALLSTNLVEVGSVLCYVVTEGESS